VQLTRFERERLAAVPNLIETQRAQARLTHVKSSPKVLFFRVHFGSVHRLSSDSRSNSNEPIAAELEPGPQSAPTGKADRARS
jgi:hypothetical protein